MRVPVEVGVRLEKAGAPWIVWEVVEICELAQGPHARLRRVGDWTTEITISLSTLADGRSYRTVSDPAAPRTAA